MTDKAIHIAAAAEALAVFQRNCGAVDEHAIADLICDLGLLADARDLNFLSEAKRGVGHWFTERHARPDETLGPDAMVDIRIAAKAHTSPFSLTFGEGTFMAKSDFEAPLGIQAITEQSLRQARSAFEGLAAATRNMVRFVEPVLPSEARELNGKALSYAEANIKAAWDFAEKLARAKSPQEFSQLQIDFAKAQFDTLQEQSKEFGAAVESVIERSRTTEEQ